MKRFNPERFPLLRVLERNRLTTKIFELTRDTGEEPFNRMEFSLRFLVFKDIEISVISNRLHALLLDETVFLEHKVLLSDTQACAGLLFLPDALVPLADEGENGCMQEGKACQINAVFYVWMGHRDYDKIAGDYDGEKESTGRTLLILPFCYDKLVFAGTQGEMMSTDDLYAFPLNKMYERNHFGRIHDYVMSFILVNQCEQELKLGKKVFHSYFIADYNKIQVLE